MGYRTAHEDIVGQCMERLRVTAAEVGDAYRAVEREPGWSAVKDEVEAFLVKFEVYCTSLLPTLEPESNILGVDLTVARKRGGAAVKGAGAGPGPGAGAVGMEAA